MKAKSENAVVEPVLFNTAMRKTFVEGVLQDAKGYFEMRSEGRVEVTYEDFALKNHEFGFKMHLKRGRGCSKQLFNEVCGAFINVISYMFPGNDEQYDIAYSTSSSNVEVELVSNW